MFSPGTEREHIAWLKELQREIWKPGEMLFKRQKLSCSKEARKLTVEEFMRLYEILKATHFVVEIQPKGCFSFGFNICGRCGGENSGELLLSFVAEHVSHAAFQEIPFDNIQAFRDALFALMEPIFRDQRNINQLVLLGKSLPQHRGAYEY